MSLTIALGLCSTSYSQTPLTEEEKRKILKALIELQSARVQITTYEEYVKREKELDAKEREIFQQQLELEKKSTEMAQKERDLAAEKATFYENAYKQVTKKKGFKHGLCKVMTLGIGRC